MVSAALVAVGSELLLPPKADTNTLWLTEELFDLGIPVRLRLAVGDGAADTAAALEASLGLCDIVLMTGGLGPTEDDRVRDVLAALFRLPLERRPEIVRQLEERYRTYRAPVTEGVLREADLPRGARPLQNERGTAPGIWLDSDRGTVIAMPGVPVEMREMWRTGVRPVLARRHPGAPPARRVLRATGRGESALADILPRDLPEGVDRTILAGPGSVDIHHLAWGGETGRARVEEAHRAAREALGDLVYAEEMRGLEDVVAGLLVEREETLALAESCTGGLLAHRLTEVPGVSATLLAGWVVYSNDAKVRDLGLDESLLAEHGAVSAPVARHLASAARERAGADWGIGITGIAGPEGGTAEKPVGTVHFGLAGPDGLLLHERKRFGGTRAQVKLRSTQHALEMLRRALLAREV